MQASTLPLEQRFLASGSTTQVLINSSRLGAESADVVGTSVLGVVVVGLVGVVLV